LKREQQANGNTRSFLDFYPSCCLLLNEPSIQNYEIIYETQEKDLKQTGCQWERGMKTYRVLQRI